ncbi:Baseplate structural protein Gp9/Gp10 [uncultured Caudovirales phage]|uniref:Baseplate structural protein Gp9/Gp10 n=1 Tax=uncultured Caudovirales phage TaxID=2100421 RepID=A0A6J5KVW3_9CAUD|nr:Baseplate structural protein Gp9/Gp10 [uncultured Caudovirales phage]
MTQQTINLGTTPNDGTGDKLRVALGKVNNNFTELYSTVGNSTVNTRNDEATYTVQLSDRSGVIYMNHTNSYVNLLLPTNTAVPFPVGTKIDVVTGNIIFVGSVDSANTLIRVPGVALTLIGYDVPANSTAVLQKVESELWMLSGYGITQD